MTREDVPQDVHDVLWTAYRDAGGNMDAGAVELAREVVRLRAKLQTARERVKALEAWSSHQECCATCAEDGWGACPSGLSLREAAEGEP